MQGNDLPERIEPDAIVEALIEFRFEHEELPELILGRLIDSPVWEGYTQARLPAADIPQPIRDADSNLRYLPLIELRKKDRVVKIGGRVLSYHVVGPYPGWAVFQKEIDVTLRAIIDKLKSAHFSRIGLRYINVLRPESHHVRGLADTKIVLKVGTSELTESVNVNYTRGCGDNHVVTVKVATPDLVAGNLQPGFSLVCDIDVSSKAGNPLAEYEKVIAWITDAHKCEKAEFFNILREEVTQKLLPKRNANG